MAGTVKGIIVEIGGDTSGLQKALRNVNSATSSLSKELRGINSLLKLDPTNTELVSQKQQVLAENIEQTSQKLEELKKIQDEANASGDKVSPENYRALQREIISTENKLKDLQVQASKWTTAGKSIEEFGNKVKNVSDKLDNLGNTLTTTLTLPVLAIGTAAVTTGNDFEAQMSRVQAIAGATGDELEQLTQQAMDLGAETSFNASEVAEGMENLASAGFTTSEIMEAMPGLLDLAASSGADLATSSEIAASAIRGFGLEANTAGHVADVFAEAAARTNAQTEDMGEAMKYVAPVAKTVGLTMEETAAAIGIMSDAGIKGSQAGTTLRGGLTRIVKPTKQVAEAMETLGVEFYDSNGKMKSLTEIIQTLQEHTAGLTDEVKNQALAQIFGTEALSGMLALVDRGSDELKNMTKSFEKCDGSAEEMADTMLDNTSGALESLSGSFETAGIAIQKALSPEIKKLAKWIQGLVDNFSDLSDEEQLNIIKTVALVAAIGPAIKILSKLSSGVGTVIKGVGTFSQAIAVAKNNATSSITSVNNLASTFKFLASPMGIATTALGLLIAAFVLAIEKQNQYALNLIDTRDKLNDAKKAQDEFNTSLQDSYNAEMSEITNVQSLANELQTLVDKNGKVKEGYEGRVDFILNELNEALGTEYKLNGNIVESYDKIVNSIDEVIQKKRAEILLANEEEKYNEALNKRTEAYNNLKQAQQELNEVTEKYSKAAQNGDEYTKALWDSQLKLAKENLKTAETTYQDYLNDIATYESDYATVMSGNNEQIQKLLDSRSYSYQSASGDLAETVANNIQQVQTEVEYYKQAYEKDLANNDSYNAEKNKTQKEAAEKRLKDLADELMSITSTTEELTPATIEAWKGLASGSYDVYSEYLAKMTPEMQQKIQDITGVLANDTGVQNEAASLGQRINSNLASNLDGITSGKNYVSGITQGVSNNRLLNNLYLKVQSLGRGMVNALNTSLDEHSPSKLTEKTGINFVQGLINGTLDKRKEVLNSVEALGNDMANRLNMNLDELNVSSKLNNLSNSTKMIFTTPTLNIYTQGEVNFRKIADEVNRIFGSQY